jgi:hypothetical protein
LVRLLRLLLIVALCAFSAPAAAIEPLPPGLEKDVERLIEGSDALGAYTLTGARITALAVEFRLTRGDSTAVLQLLPQNESGVGDKIGDTRSFSLWLVTEPTAEVQTSAQLLLKRIAANDDGTFYTRAASLRRNNTTTEKRVGDGAPVEARALGRWDGVRRALTWAVMLALLAWTVTTTLRRRPSRDDLLWWGALTLLGIVGIVLRLKVPHWAPLHANSHGIAELRGLVGSSVPGAPIETDRYGFAYGQVVRAFIGAWGGSWRTALGFAAVAGGLAIPAMGLFVAALFRNRWSGLFAALVLTLHPAHVTLSLSESPMPLAMTLWLVSLWAVLAAPQVEGPARKRMQWLAALALASAVELSVPTLSFLVATLAALLIWRLSKATSNLREWLLPVGFVALAVSAHVYSLWPVLTDAWGGRSGNMLPGLLSLLLPSPANLALDASLTPKPLVLLAVLGWLSLLVTRRFGAALSLPWLVLLPLIPAATVIACRTDLIRYQTPAQLGLIAMAAALPLAWPKKRFGDAIIGVALSLLMLPGALSGLKGLRTPSLDASAFTIAEEGLSKLNGDASIGISIRRSGKVINDFPEFLRPVSQGRLTIDDWQEKSAKELTAIWIGPSCYSFTQEEISGGALQRAVRLGGAPVRDSCVPLLKVIDSSAQPLAARVVEVPYASQEFHRIPGKSLLIGLFPTGASPSGVISAPNAASKGPLLGALDEDRRALVWFAFVGLLCWTVLSRVRARPSREDLLWWGGLALLTLVALVLRFKLPPWAPMHANNHGIAELRGLAGVTSGGPVETDLYGMAYGQVVRAFTLPWGHGWRAALGFAAIAGSLAIPALGLFVATLFRNRWSGFLAAAALAVYPAHVALSLTESPMALAMTLWLISLWAILTAGPSKDGERTRLLWLFAVGLSALFELSVPTLFFTMAALLAVLLWWRSGLVPSLRELVAPVALVLVTLVLHVAFLRQVLNDAVGSRGHRLFGDLPGLLLHSPPNMAMDPLLAGWLLLPLAGLGVVLLVVTRRWAVAASLLALVLIPLLPAAAVSACRTDFIRYQTPAHLGLIACAAALPFVWKMPRTLAMRSAVLASLLLLFTLSSLSGLNDLRVPPLDAEAFKVAADGVAGMKGEWTIHIAPRRAGKVITDFPEFIAPNAQLTVDDAPEWSSTDHCAVWIGPSCYWVAPEDPGGDKPKGTELLAEAPMRAECQRLTGRSVDAPLASKVLEVPHVEQEFHRIAGSRVKIGLYPCAPAKPPTDGAVATP